MQSNLDIADLLANSWRCVWLIATPNQECDATQQDVQCQTVVPHLGPVAVKDPVSHSVGTQLANVWK